MVAPCEQLHVVGQDLQAGHAVGLRPVAEEEDMVRQVGVGLLRPMLHPDHPVEARPRVVAQRALEQDVAQAVCRRYDGSARSGRRPGGCPTGRCRASAFRRPGPASSVSTWARTTRPPSMPKTQCILALWPTSALRWLKAKTSGPQFSMVKYSTLLSVGARRLRARRCKQRWSAGPSPC